MSTNDVRDFYGKIPSHATDTSHHNQRVAEAFGYTPDELSTIPQDANLGLSCGNPLAIAHLKEGETLVDLGSGAGLDVFLSAHKVGENGKAIGVDMTENMLELARRNAVTGGYRNVEFIKSNITNISLPDSSADIVCSNCVINLVPAGEKHRVFQEIFRILKPGGRLAISDILAKTELPDNIRNDITLFVGCISGASQPGEYWKWMSDAGFEDIVIVDTHKDLNVYQSAKMDRIIGCGTGTGCCGSSGASTEVTVDEIDFNAYVASFQIYAVKT